MSVGTNIKRLREMKGMTQEELAQAVNVSRSMIAQIERGSRDPVMMLGVEIAKALGCEIADLMVEPKAE